MLEYSYQALMDYANDLLVLSNKIKRFLKERENIKYRIAKNLDSSYDLNSLIETYENEITEEINLFKYKVIDSTSAIKNELDSTSYILSVKEELGIYPIKDTTSIIKDPADEDPIVKK